MPSQPLMPTRLPAFLGATSYIFQVSRSGTTYFAEILNVAVSGIGPNPVARFFDSRTGTHFYTASADEAQSVAMNLNYFVKEGSGLNTIAPDAAIVDPNANSVYDFFDLQDGTHFYTESTSERDMVMQTRSDLTYDGVAFYEHATPQPGDNAVCRYFDTSNGTHFYTASTVETVQIAATRPDHQAEGIASYAPQL